MRTRGRWVMAAALTAGLLSSGCDESPPAHEVHEDQQMPPDELGDEAPDHPAGPDGERD
ncbi:hypothetical protein [Egicoccus sp. AB-alg6-2]|uniref:hypothetical protein n=1 Tax=Egicoccus sp. AB-alg6-2 TaxID=3242692 RepID=UPI00359DE7A4